MKRWGEHEIWSVKLGFGCDCEPCPIQDENILNRHACALWLSYFYTVVPKELEIP